MLQLLVLNGQDAGKCLSFQQSVVHIGTEIGNDFLVSDAQMSGYHGQIICSREGHYSYSDLQSEHGTRVRAQELDVYLHNTQFPQSVALAGDVEFEIGSTIIACQYRDELEEAIDIRRVSSLSLLTLPRSGDVDMMRFLLETSLELTAKTTHQAVMSYLSKVILQRMGLASHIAVWKLDACSNAFSCIYERSRCNYVQTPLLPDELLRDATQHREAILYRIAGTSLINVIVAPLMTSTRDLGVLIVDSSHVSGLGNTELETHFLQRRYQCAFRRIHPFDHIRHGCSRSRLIGSFSARLKIRPHDRPSDSRFRVAGLQKRPVHVESPRRTPLRSPPTRYRQSRLATRNLAQIFEAHAARSQTPPRPHFALCRLVPNAIAPNIGQSLHFSTAIRHVSRSRYAAQSNLRSRRTCR